MNEKKETELGNSLLAVLGGIAAMALVGLILYPLESLVFDEFFELGFSSNSNKVTTNDIILNISIVIWLSLSALAGGFICSLICKTREYVHALVITGLLVITIAIFSRGPFNSFEVITSLLELIFVCLSLLGGAKAGIRLKKKRKEKILVLGDDDDV